MFQWMNFARSPDVVPTSVVFPVQLRSTCVTDDVALCGVMWRKNFFLKRRLCIFTTSTIGSVMRSSIVQSQQLCCSDVWCRTANRSERAALIWQVAKILSASATPSACFAMTRPPGL